jgi:hypothetical protein
MPTKSASASKPPRKPGHNVVKLVTNKNASIAQETAQETSHASSRERVAALAAKSAAGTRSKSKPDDARVKEAMRLAQAFLAIEDPVARGALVALAERLISYDWIRKVK